jgi:DNA-directed RNA polymerase subunit M/transcription elongation factor TFIIS
MNKKIPVNCLKCGHRWKEDLKKAQAQRVIFKGKKKTRVESYLFTCPKCDSQVVVEVEVEE